MKGGVALLALLAGMGAWEALSALVHLKDGELRHGDIKWLLATAVGLLLMLCMTFHSKRKEGRRAKGD